MSEEPFVFTVREWNEFCRQSGIGVGKPCIICGSSNQIGVDPSEDEDKILALLPRNENHEAGEMTQECTNCGHKVVYRMKPFLQWKGWL
jgi:DNA-directed RNA polymerase subunit RPC12/RpoP